MLLLHIMLFSLRFLVLVSTKPAPVPGHQAYYNLTALSSASHGLTSASGTQFSSKSFSTVSIYTTSGIQAPYTKVSSGATSFSNGKLAVSRRNVKPSSLTNGVSAASTGKRIFPSGNVSSTRFSTNSTYVRPATSNSASTTAATDLRPSSVTRTRLLTGYAYSKPSIPPGSMSTSATIVLPKSSATPILQLSTVYMSSPTTSRATLVTHTSSATPAATPSESASAASS